MFCRNCGYSLSNHMKFCPGCGVPVHNYDEAEDNKSPANDSSIIDSTSLKKGGKKLTSREMLLYAVAAVLIILILLVLSALLKKDTKGRLEEKLRLGAAYLEDMNFDMALDAYAKAIEIDERDPRPYLGRADAYMSRAAQKIEEAQEERDFDSAAQDLALAEKDIQKAETLIQADDYAPREENLVSQEEIDSYRESREQLKKEEKTKRSSSSYAEKIAEEVLGLPYLGNTSYYEAISNSGIDQAFGLDLYDGRGYIAAGASDLDGDGEDEIFVVSLEGEDALGHGRNAILFHVLEKENDSWHEQVRLDPEQDSGYDILSSTVHLEQDVFLRSEKDTTSVYMEIHGYPDWAEPFLDWSFCKYIYDGTSLSAAAIGGAGPYELYYSGYFYFDYYDPFDDPHSDDHAAFSEVYRSASQNLSEACLPVPDLKEYYDSRILDNDNATRNLASFQRVLDYPSGVDFPDRTLVSLLDWTYAEGQGEDVAQRSAPPDIYQLALYRRIYKSAKADFNKRVAVNDFFGYGSYSFYDIDHDGISEMLIKMVANHAEDNMEQTDVSIYTVKDGAAVRIPLDYTISDGEYCTLDVSKDGKTFLYACKHRNLDIYSNESTSNYMVYEITILDGQAKTDYVSSFTGSIAAPVPSGSLLWLDEYDTADFKVCDLIRRFYCQLPAYCYLNGYNIRGNDLSGFLLTPGSDYPVEVGSAVIHMENETADVYYYDSSDSFHEAEHLDLR